MNHIAFLTDWGLSSYYVSVCKSVIKRINKNTDIIDITHSAGHFNIRKYAALILRAARDFEEGTVFLCVVDPTVGSSRKPIALKTSKYNYYFVGPDNGLFTFLMQEFGVKESVELSDNRFFYKTDYSSTFHGRDIFAPVAAYISKGISIDHFGPKTEKLITFDVQKPIIEDNKVICDYLYSDDFGNIETNLSSNYLEHLDIGKEVTVEINGIKEVVRFVKNYSEVKKGELLLHVDSSGFYEVSANQSNAANKFNITDDFEGKIKINFEL
ncbi:SAM hydrolase/SAM-dependent halogenase family protein [Petrotoga halophila]|uniref:S-adenosyl-l-methionine hydroxide adenosyltransferase n=1 Tax=Petrotoga halophila DSM 16923 TaxID=1122953 RepID=A0A2S5EG89_9BACT|nr:SAM-dependent chlorinase/fluorinase [Petrotoga halophila]POZ92156.1 hypothetical protein AA81_08710 [Petrotoga halophila DSM 16923]